MRENTEEWRPVTLPEFSATYAVSDCGHVRKLDGMLLRASPTGQHHHLQLKLRAPSGRTKNAMISHLVMSAFGEAPDGRPVGFRDGNSANNSFDNLYFPHDSLANGGGHTKQMLSLSVEKLSVLIWKELLPLTTPFLLRMAAGD